MKAKRLLQFKGIRTQMVLERPTFCLTQSFRLICFTVFPYLEISCARVYCQLKLIFLQIKVFIKETDFTNLSLISSFLLEFSRKTVFEGNSEQKNHCIMIKSKVRTLSNISHGAFVQKKSTAKNLSLQTVLSSMFDWVIDVSPMMTVARY